MVYYFNSTEYETFEEAAEDVRNSIDLLDLSDGFSARDITSYDFLSAFDRARAKGKPQEFYDWMAERIEEIAQDIIEDSIIEEED